MAVMQIENWNHLSPILLPFENSSTMPSILSGSLGILVPCIVFVSFMFNHLYGTWKQNVEYRYNSEINNDFSSHSNMSTGHLSSNRPPSLGKHFHMRY